MQNPGPRSQDSARPARTSKPLERKCRDCACFVPDGGAEKGDCKFNPLAVRKHAVDWCWQFTPRG